MQFDPKNPKWFYSINETPELKILEENYSVILDELNNLRKNSDNGYWQDTFPNYLHPESKNKWKTFTFQFFGIKHTQNCSLCPRTYDVLKKIPSLITAEISFLPPHTHIAPHKGFTKMVLRAHLGLIIPENCALRVGDEMKTWEQGKMLIFDDSFEHEAWNKSDKDRFVLMLDIANPKWEYTPEEICKYKIDTISDPIMLNMFPKEAWKTFLEKGEFPAH